MSGTEVATDTDTQNTKPARQQDINGTEVDRHRHTEFKLGMNGTEVYRHRHNSSLTWMEAKYTDTNRFQARQEWKRSRHTQTEIIQGQPVFQTGMEQKQTDADKHRIQGHAADQSQTADKALVLIVKMARNQLRRLSAST